MNNSTTVESEKNLAQTPWWFIRSLQDYIGITFILDVAAKEDTAKAINYYSIENGENGLDLHWDLFNFCNPPFSNIQPWIKKARIEAKEGAITALLIPDKAEVGFTRLARDIADTVIHMPFRLNFLRPDGIPFLDSKGKPSGPKFAVCVYLITPWGINMPIRDTYFDFRVKG